MSQPNLLSAQPPLDPTATSPSFVVIDPTSRQSRLASPTASSSTSSGKKLQQRRRRRSLVVRNSLQATVPLLPAIFFPPNLPRPQPAPGLMPTRGGGQKSVESRTLAAAHTQFRAKTVFFYKDGDNYFTGVRVPICKARFRTMDALMDSLNESIALPYGVRQLHTPTGRTAIRSLDELQPQGRYIAASSIRRVRGVDLETVERRKRLREDAQRRWNFQQSMPAPDSGGSSAQVQQQQQPSRSAAVSSSGKSEGQPFRGRVRSSHGDYELTNRTNPFLPVTSKQIYFVLNGHPHCVYRALVNPLRRGHLLDSLLEEVSEGLQAAIFRIYSFEGDRILSVDQLLKLKDMRAIAVPRHERLQLNGMTQSDILRLPMRLPGSTSASSLPPIKKDGGSSKNSSSKSSSGGGSQTKVRQPNNNIDRLPAYDDPMVRLNLVEVNRRKRSRSPMRNDSHLPKAAAIPTGGKAGLEAPGTAAMRQRAFTSTAVPVQSQPGAKTATTDATTAASTSNTTADSDSGRPRSAMELELPSQGGPQDELLLQLEEDEREEDEDNEEDEDDQQGDNEEEEDDSSDNEDDYPEEPPELMAIRKRKRRKRQHTIDEEEEEGAAAIDMGNRDAEEEETRGLKQLPADDDERVEEIERRTGKEEEDGRRQPSGRPQASSSRKSTQIEVIHSDEHGHPIGGQYSEELELILYGQAAVKIQSAWRGYAARKELKRTRFAEHPTYINEDQASSRRGAKASSHSNFYKPNERHQAIVQRVKTPMPGQKGPNSVLKKKSSTLLNPSDYGTETLADSASDREDINVLELVQAKKGLGWEMADPQKSPSLSRRSPKTEYIYTVTLITGNRWAADTEADVYVQLQGAEMDSGKLWLRQEFTNWLQCAPNGQRFRQNQSDSFTFRLPRRIGIIKKVTVGHECRGYGAGIFIDRILVTEDEEESEDDCRQFLFLCNKWFDSGQVDGKLERTIRLSAFYEIGSIPVDNRVTSGRWEFVLHNGTEKGQGGTSSLLTITGYGTRGQSSTEGLFDSNMAKVPSESLMQVDFGDIGELLKIRIEIDGNGPNPDYFLNFVEFKDLDTDERFVVMCGKWLRWASTKKGEQPFRELFAFHIGVEPLPLIAYEGKVRVLAPRIDCLSQREVQMELHGDLGETGFFRVDLASPALQSISGQQQKFGEEAAEEEENELNGNAAEKIDIAFKVEAVSVGRVTGARVQFQPNQMGHQIVEGLVAVQQLFQKQGLWPLAANSEFLVGRILLRESAHTPYRYVLTRSQFQEVASTSADPDSQHFTKEMLTTEMQGISTRLPKRKEPARVPPNWLLQMSLAYGSTLLPEVFLCGENGTARMLPLDTSPSDGMLSFQPENAEDIGSLRKVRICTDGLALLTGQANDTARQQTGTDDEPSTLVEKIRVCDTANGQELRFPAADCQLQRHSVFEMSAIWPDRPPTPIVIYLIRIVSGEAHSSPNPALTVRLNLFGEFGDVGWRTLSAQESERPGPAAAEQPQQQIALFAPKTKNSFEFEAVSIGEIESAELEVRSQDENFRWECTEMVVTDTNTALFYTFAFDRPFSAVCPAQRCQTLPFTNAL